ncbi:MAG TPA: DNA recombination protein RmuC [Gammaproteobacteria bacterium]|nr:DNA recombination protein RmuC [Gammaproteobacteria bacterium]
MSADPLLLAIVAAAAALLGALLAHLRAQRRIGQLSQENAALRATLEMERKTAAEKLATVEAARERLTETFQALSSEALKSNNEAFLKLAQEKLRQHTIQAREELGRKEQSIEHLVKPIRELLEQTQQQMRQIEQERKEAYGSISKHLETIAQTQQLLHGETRNLVQALRRPEVRGQWGELTLRRLVELAGMVEHCDFFEQEHTRTEAGAVRPDMIVRMPGGREIVVDVKTPLDAYLSAVEAGDDETRAAALARHARNVRDRVQELAGKAYWSQFSRSPDFVVLFIPGEHFLSAALERDPALLEDALARKVILATPTSLVALLRAVAFGWNQQALAENAERIRDLGEDLYKRLATFSSHLAKLGRQLGGSIDAYNKAVGSFERQLLPGARKFTEMGIQSARAMEPPEQLDRNVRQVAQQNEE